MNIFLKRLICYIITAQHKTFRQTADGASELNFTLLTDRWRQSRKAPRVQDAIYIRLVPFKEIKGMVTQLRSALHIGVWRLIRVLI